MDNILINTHKKRNIDIMKARNYYFNRARRVHLLSTMLLCLPAFTLAISYVFDSVQFVSESRDLVVGLLAIIVFFVNYKLDGIIETNKEKSNMLREHYDNEVFGISRNTFTYKYNIDECIGAAKKVKDNEKYEVWYGEVFCSDKYANVICAQMDNIVYTYHIYKATRIIYGLLLAVVIAATIFLCVLTREMMTSALIFVAVFDIIKTLLENMKIAKDLEEENKTLKEKVMAAEISEDPEIHVRCLQDCIIHHRNSSLFVPKIIRNVFLKNAERMYYAELNRVREKFMGTQRAHIPKEAADIDVLGLQDEVVGTLADVHNRLRKMFAEVNRVFADNGIAYILDGGTLIGAVREAKAEGKESQIKYRDGRFLFWDDDVDIAIPRSQLEKAKEVLRGHDVSLGVVQDYSEEFYSPRLSSFRIRENGSKTEEKDSPLYKKYIHRGLFVDVYTYGPILVNRVIDAIFRFLWIHLINQRIKKIEIQWAQKESDEDKDRIVESFRKIKKRYLNRVKWYNKYAKNEKFYAYTPTYIDNLKKAGPYIKRDDLYKIVIQNGEMSYETNYAVWEGIVCQIPIQPEVVLKKIYGKKWNESPYIAKNVLLTKHKENWYSHHEFHVTALKHLSRIDLSL